MSNDLTSAGGLKVKPFIKSFGYMELADLGRKRFLLIPLAIPLDKFQSYNTKDFQVDVHGWENSNDVYAKLTSKAKELLLNYPHLDLEPKIEPNHQELPNLDENRRFAVGFISFFENLVKLDVIKAKDEVEAIKIMVVNQQTTQQGKEEIQKWLDGYDELEKIKEACYESDLGIEVVEIKQ